MASKKKLTPLMEQYWSIKKVHQDKILLFRMGDFFEMFYEDALTAAPLVGITLTQRNKKAEDSTPMCGVPHHSIAGPINKLLACGHKVAICDQVEDPKLAKGIVKRAVTQILTPGMVYDPDTLDRTRPNYIAAFDDDKMAFLESSTGEAFYVSLANNAEVESYKDLFQISELIVTNEQLTNEFVQKSSFSVHEEIADESHPLLNSGVPDCAQRLVSYIEKLSDTSRVQWMKPFEYRSYDKRLFLSSKVLSHLEVFRNYSGETSGTLFEAINHTKTAGGARLLRKWLSLPLRDLVEIKRRQEKISLWYQQIQRVEPIQKNLSLIGDIERKLSKISSLQVTPRDILGLGQTLERVKDLYYSDCHGDWDEQDLNKVHELSQEITTQIKEDPPLSTLKGGIFNKGVFNDLDELIELATNSESLIREMEEAEKESTGIPSLKIRYNQVFGYYIEVTKTHKDKVPDRYMRKQTLTNAERYCTDELVELERKVLSAFSKRNDLEAERFQSLREKILKAAAPLLRISYLLSEMDIFVAFAWLSLERNWCQPTFTKEPEFQLELCRHPVLEKGIGSHFVPNTLTGHLGTGFLITGPNMAGKSTVMRQMALAVIMAQCGFPVAAQSACLPIFEEVFTRIGASDQLSEGLSTFMVEMTETAEMLDRAGPKSLVILDEVGRGTSTFDGMSLAQAVIEDLVLKQKSTTFFATHYHELVELEEKHPQIINHHMKVSHQSKDLQFLYVYEKGPAKKSYGIEVADLAGVKKTVVKRAQQILRERELTGNSPQMGLFQFVEQEEKELFLQNSPLEEIKDSILGFSVSDETPLSALNKISSWQKDLKNL